MPDPGFRTAAEAAREQAAQDENTVERVKRAIESCVAAEGFRPRDRVGQYCSQVGIGVRITAGAGVEFDTPNARDLAHAIARTPMPDTLRRYHE